MDEFKQSIQTADKSQIFMDFWRCLTVCHDVIQMKVGTQGEDKAESYQGASQDEVTFLDMCKETNFVHFKERTSDKIFIELEGGKIETYKILHMIEFTSGRKRMSIIVKREEDDKVFNFIKGADMAIIPRLTEESKKESAETIELMNEFASQGLRTLMFGVKELHYDEGTDFREIKDEELEEGITMLGTTGLEDLLQDNVAATIKDFRKSGIKVWMLTGDKGETAHNIGISCGLIDPIQHEVHEIKGQDRNELAKRIKEAVRAMCKDAPSALSQIGQGDDETGDIEMEKTFATLLDGTSLPLIFNDMELCDMLNSIF